MERRTIMMYMKRKGCCCCCLEERKLLQGRMCWLTGNFHTNEWNQSMSGQGNRHPNANTLIFLFCCAAYLCAEIKTRSYRAQTVDLLHTLCSQNCKNLPIVCLWVCRSHCPNFWKIAICAICQHQHKAMAFDTRIRNRKLLVCSGTKSARRSRLF